MAAENVTSEVVASKKSKEEVPEYTVVSQDIKPSDAEENHNSQSPPGELKRRLKSRHLQMIAIGTLTSKVIFFLE